MIDEKKLVKDICNYEIKIQENYKLKPNELNAFLDGLNRKQIAVMECISKQPRVEEWIPCSERLPEKDGVYIVDDRAFNSPWVHTAGFKVSSKAWCENHGVYYDDKYGRYEDGRVIAWQPLPEPWKEKTHDR